MKNKGPKKRDVTQLGELTLEQLEKLEGFKAIPNKVLVIGLKDYGVIRTS